MPTGPRTPSGPFFSAVTNLLFPPRCQVCDRFCDTPLCSACAESFHRLRPPWCERCGKPFPAHVKTPPLCADCARERRPVLDRTRSLGLHIESLRDAVNAFKFGGRVRLAEPLGRLLAELLSRKAELSLVDPAGLDLIVPVPLHPARRRWRGYDQAELLAAVLGEATGIGAAAGWLTRTRNTPPQVGRTRSAREQNVRGAFAVRGPSPVPEARVLLVDDVHTTGSTLRECARVLRRAGAQAVYAVTLSRAAPDWHPAADLIADA